MLFGSTCALTNNVLADFKLFGMNMFDLFDFMSSNVLLPIGGIALALYVSWVWGADQFARALSNDGTLENHNTARVVIFLLRYVSPVLIFPHNASVWAAASSASPLMPSSSTTNSSPPRRATVSPWRRQP